MPNMTISVSESHAEELKAKGYSASKIFRYAMVNLKAHAEGLTDQEVACMDNLVDYIGTLRAQLEKLRRANYEMGKQNVKLATENTQN